MNTKIIESLKPWAGVFTWHTSHPLDQKRFFEAVESLYQECGSDIGIDQITQAIEEITANAPASLDGEIPQSKVKEYAQRAYGILGFLGHKAGAL